MVSKKERVHFNVGITKSDDNGNKMVEMNAHLLQKKYDILFADYIKLRKENHKLLTTEKRFVNTSQAMLAQLEKLANYSRKIDTGSLNAGEIVILHREFNKSLEINALLKETLVANKSTDEMIGLYLIRAKENAAKILRQAKNAAKVETDKLLVTAKNKAEKQAETYKEAEYNKITQEKKKLVSEREKTDALITRQKKEADNYLADKKKEGDRYLTAKKAEGDKFLTQKKEESETYLVNKKHEAEALMKKYEDKLANVAKLAEAEKAKAEAEKVKQVEVKNKAKKAEEVAKVEELGNANELEKSQAKPLTRGEVETNESETEIKDKASVVPAEAKKKSFFKFLP